MSGTEASPNILSEWRTRTTCTQSAVGWAEVLQTANSDAQHQGPEQKPQTMRSLLTKIAFTRRLCEICSVWGFVLCCACANLYFLVIGVLVEVAKISHFEIFGAFAIFLMFFIPFVAFGIIGAYFLSITLALMSLRPVPLVLAAVAWSISAGYAPNAHLQWFKTHSFDDWFYPFLYSFLTIFGATLVQLMGKPSRTVAVQHQGSDAME